MSADPTLLLRRVDDGVVTTAVWPLSAIRAALSAAGLCIEQGWQPIETAPRDGTLVHCWAPAVAGDYPQPVQRLDRWEGKYAGFGWMRPGQPYTHWRPLPAAPQEERDDGR